MADRVGVINKGELILVEDKTELMRKLGKKQLTLHLQEPARRRPARARAPIASRSPRTAASSSTATTPSGERTGITALLDELLALGIRFKDLNTTQTSLEDIFVDLVRQDR